MALQSYQTTGRGMVASGFLVPVLDDLIVRVRSFPAIDVRAHDERADVLTILNQLRQFAVTLDQSSENTA
jgi:hypothetical protein